MSDRGAAFDHLIHWVPDIDVATAQYGAAGLPTHDVFTMSGFRNAAWGVDDERYVELASVDDWEAVRSSKYAGSLAVLEPAVRALGGTGLLTFAVDVPDVFRTAASLRKRGYLVEEVEVRFEERNAGFVEAFVRDAPPYFPFFITYDPPRAELAKMRAEHRRQQGIDITGRPDLVALVVRSTEPESDARRLGELLDVTVDGTTVRLPGAEVRFEPGETTGLYGFVTRGTVDSTRILGAQVIAEK